MIDRTIEKIVLKLSESGPNNITVNGLREVCGVNRQDWTNPLNKNVDLLIRDLIKTGVIRVGLTQTELDSYYFESTVEGYTMFGALICNLSPIAGYNLLSEIKVMEAVEALNSSFPKFNSSIQQSFDTLNSSIKSFTDSTRSSLETFDSSIKNLKRSGNITTLGLLILAIILSGVAAAPYLHNLL